MKNTAYRIALVVVDSCFFCGGMGGFVAGIAVPLVRAIVGGGSGGGTAVPSGLAGAAGLLGNGSWFHCLALGHQGQALPK